MPDAVETDPEATDLAKLFENFDGGKPEPDPKPTTAADKTQSPDAVLLAIQSLQQQVNGLARDQQNIQVATSPAQVSGPVIPVAQQAAPALDFSGLPDQAEDPAGYQKALGDRIQATIATGVTSAMSSQVTAQAAAQAENTKIAGLWADFQVVEPEMGKHSNFVKVAYNEVRQRVLDRGQDFERYQHVTRDAFFTELAAETRKVMGPRAEELLGDGSGDTVDGEVMRTQGILDPKGKPSDTKKAEAETEGPGMLDQIAKEQLAGGFY